MLIEPVSAAALGVVMFGEPLTVATLGGGVLLLSAATFLALADLRSGRGVRPSGGPVALGLDRQSDEQQSHQRTGDRGRPGEEVIV